MEHANNLTKTLSLSDQEILQRKLKSRRLFLGLTYQNLSEKTGISKSTLQRYESGGIAKLPFDKIFSISEALDVPTSYFTEITDNYSADYLNNELINDNFVIPYENTIGSFISYNSEVKKIRSEITKAAMQFESEVADILTPKLFKDGYNIKRLAYGSIGDLVATKGKETWVFDLMFINDMNKYITGTGATHQVITNRFGKLAIFDKPIAKYTIVVNRPEIAEKLLEFQPRNLNIDITIMYIHKDNLKEYHYPEITTIYNVKKEKPSL